MFLCFLHPVACSQPPQSAADPVASIAWLWFSETIRLDILHPKLPRRCSLPSRPNGSPPSFKTVSGTSRHEFAVSNMKVAMFAGYRLREIMSTHKHKHWRTWSIARKSRWLASTRRKRRLPARCSAAERRTVQTPKGMTIDEWHETKRDIQLPELGRHAKSMENRMLREDGVEGYGKESCMETIDQVQHDCSRISDLWQGRSILAAPFQILRLTLGHSFEVAASNLKITCDMLSFGKGRTTFTRVSGGKQSQPIIHAVALLTFWSSILMVPFISNRYCYRNWHDGWLVWKCMYQHCIEYFPVDNVTTRSNQHVVDVCVSS